MIDRYLSVEDVAARLGVHPQTVLRYIHRGCLQATRIGKYYRITPDALEAFAGSRPAVVPHAGPVILAVANQKGGVGKTTTAVNLAVGLAALGRRVLLIDMDPQGGCAVCLGLNPSEIAREQTVYRLLCTEDEDWQPSVRTVHRLAFVPANDDLAGAEIDLRHVLAPEAALARKLPAIAPRYDVVILDTPPNLGILTINALAAATGVLVPVSCEYMSLRGLELLLDTARRVQKMINPRLDVLGILPTRYAGQTVNSREVLEFLRQFCQRTGLRLFEPPVRQSVRVQEAPRTGLPLVLSDPAHETALAYRALATEISTYVEQKASAAGGNRSRQATQRY